MATGFTPYPGPGQGSYASRSAYANNNANGDINSTNNTYNNDVNVNGNGNGNMQARSQQPYPQTAQMQQPVNVNHPAGGAQAQANYTMTGRYNQFQAQPQPQPQYQSPQTPTQTQTQTQYQSQHQQPSPIPNAISTATGYFQQKTPAEKEAQDQARFLQEATSRVQESSHYMHEAMELDDLALTLEKTTLMLSELGDSKHHHHHHGNKNVEPDIVHGTTAILSPKNYYELHTLVLQELPNLEEYLLSLARSSRYTPFQLYEIVQYCPRAVPRLYLQICVASVWIRAEEGVVDVPWLLRDLREGVRCVQCPIRGLFLRYFMLQALRDKLPDCKEEQEQVEAIKVGEEKQGEDAEPNDNGNDDDNHNDKDGEITDPAAAVVQEEEVQNDQDVNLNDLMGDGTTANFLDVADDQEEDLADKMDAVAIDDNLETAPSSTTNVDDRPDNDNATKRPTATPTTNEVVRRSYEFILSNLIEMNKLWVRIQHMPGDRNTKESRKRRERERNELRVLVGTNVALLSELEGVTSSIYGTVILPRVLEEVVKCRDPLAQAYLMDCIVSVFPDEFHVQTLEVVLGVCPKLRDKVNVRTILQSLMDRLATYREDGTLLDDVEDTEGVKNLAMLDAFEVFGECIESVLRAKGCNVTAREVVRLEASLLEFSVKCHPDKLDHMDRCLGACASTLRGDGVARALAGMDGVIASKPIHMDAVAIAELEKLLSIPLETLALDVLELDHYSELLAFLPLPNRKAISMKLLEVTEFSTAGQQMNLSRIEQLLAIVSPLLQGGVDVDDPAFLDEQTSISKLFHNIYDEDTDVNFEMLTTVYNHIPLDEKSRRSYTLPPLIYATLKLLNRIRSIEFPLSTTTSFVGDEELMEESLGQEEKDDDDDDVLSYDDNDDGGGVSEEDALSYDNDDDNNEGENTEKTMDDTDGDEKIELNDEDQEDAIAVQGSEEDEKDGGSKEEVENIDENKNYISEGRGEVVTREEEEMDEPQIAIFSKQINCRKVFLFLQKMLAALKESNPELSLDQTLQVAIVSDTCQSFADQNGKDHYDLNAVTYEFMTQALLTYERDISDSKLQEQKITSMVGTLLSIRSLEKTDYEALITKTTQYAARLLKKTDQCKMVLLCSHLFFRNEDKGAYQNPQRALECLQRSLKIADACTKANPSNLYLFVDILDRYLYFYEKENPAITDKFISGLIALVNQHISSIGVQSPAVEETKSRLLKIVQYVEDKKISGDSSKKFQPIVCKH